MLLPLLPLLPPPWGLRGLPGLAVGWTGRPRATLGTWARGGDPQLPAGQVTHRLFSVVPLLLALQAQPGALWPNLLSWGETTAVEAKAAAAEGPCQDAATLRLVFAVTQHDLRGHHTVIFPGGRSVLDLVPLESQIHHFPHRPGVHVPAGRLAVWPESLFPALLGPRVGHDFGQTSSLPGLQAHQFLEEALTSKRDVCPAAAGPARSRLAAAAAGSPLPRRAGSR